MDLLWSDYRKNLMKKQTKHLGWGSQMQSCGSHHNIVVLSTIFLYSLNRNASIQEFAPDWVRYPYIMQVIPEELPGITLREIPVLLPLHKGNFKYLEKTLSLKQKRGPKHQNDRWPKLSHSNQIYTSRNISKVSLIIFCGEKKNSPLKHAMISLMGKRRGKKKKVPYLHGLNSKTTIINFFFLFKLFPVILFL